MPHELRPNRVIRTVCRLRSLGLQPRTKSAADGKKFPYVLFAAPPSGSEDYVGEVSTRLFD